MSIIRLVAVVLAAASCVAGARAQVKDRLSFAVPKGSLSGLSQEQFQQLHALVRPQPGESRWEEIPWMTSLVDARKQAVAVDRPLIVYICGGGHLLGRC